LISKFSFEFTPIEDTLNHTVSGRL
jgi:hypothetical protein